MIGIFDSGYGGLTIVRELIKQLPKYSYMYFGDNAHAPYGEKSKEEILTCTQQGVHELFRRGCILVILGCNTASAVALRELQQHWLPNAWPNKKLLGIVVPTLEQITNAQQEKTVGVLATKATVESGAYEAEIHARNPRIRVVQYACNNLAGLIEAEGANSDTVKQEAKRCVDALVSPPARGVRQLADGGSGSLDAVLLGCTHYELIANSIASALPKGTTLFHQPSIVAESLTDYLKRHPEIDSRMEKTGKRTYLTTGNPAEVSLNSMQMMGENIDFRVV